MARRRVAFRKKRQNRLGMILVTLVVIMLFVVILVKSIDLKEKKAAYDEKEIALEQAFQPLLDAVCVREYSEMILQNLESRNFLCVTVDELFDHYGVPLLPNREYTGCEEAAKGN